jgi:hypothetical protein
LFAQHFSNKEFIYSNIKNLFILQNISAMWLINFDLIYLKFRILNGEEKILRYEKGS